MIRYRFQERTCNYWKYAKACMYEPVPAILATAWMCVDPITHIELSDVTLSWDTEYTPSVLYIGVARICQRGGGGGAKAWKGGRVWRF